MSSPSSVERLDAIINRVRTLSSTNSSAPASNATPAPAVKRTHPAQGASSNNRPAAPAASATPTAFVGTDPFDVAWFPAVPDGHSAFSWGGDEETISSSSGPAAAAATPSAEVVKPQAPPSKVSKESEKKPQESKAAKQEQAPKQGGDKKGKDGAQKQGKQQQPKKAEETKAPENSQAPFTRVEFRVGKIISAEKHPNADKMFVEQIDVGEAQPRQICSGLVGLVPLEELANAMVVVVANLKPADLRGKMSAGMILAASTADGAKASLVLAPAGSKVGERVYLHNASEEDRKLPVDASVDIKDKKNPWAAVAPDLKTNENGEVVFKDAKLVTSSGPLKSALSGCRVK